VEGNCVPIDAQAECGSYRGHGGGAAVVVVQLVGRVVSEGGWLMTILGVRVGRQCG